MAIALYDIDLWHQGKSYPNLELMKVYNYLYSNNQIVHFLKPNDDKSWFKKIIYFKDNSNTIVPNKLKIRKKDDIYGYGFYKTIAPLKPEIAIMPPTYLPYDAWSEKLKNHVTYDRMKNSSYVRLETHDFSDYKIEAKYIYIADHDALYQNGMEEFLQEYKNHNFIFTNLITARSEEVANKFIRYSNLFDRRIYIDFDFNEDFFYNNYKEKILFNYCRRDNESQENHLMRLIKIILWQKRNNLKIGWKFNNNLKTLEDYIIYWGTVNKCQSYFEYYNDSKKALDLMINANSSIRLLLKQNPKNVTRSSLDLKSNL